VLNWLVLCGYGVHHETPADAGVEPPYDMSKQLERFHGICPPGPLGRVTVYRFLVTDPSCRDAFTLESRFEEREGDAITDADREGNEQIDTA